MSKMLFADLLIEKDGLIKGPFGGDIKKSLFVTQTKDTYKVYEQGVVLKNDINYGTYYISKEHFESKLKRFEVKKGDLLMTGAGTLGEILTVPENAPKGVINQALLRIRLNESVISSTFFKYYFKYYIKAIISRINGDSVIPNLPPLPLIRNTEVDIPDTIYQNKIASVLSALDSKIELNNRMNAVLESMAKTLYDYWFVQFDFPDKNGKPYKTSGGKMVWNEQIKREIPEGWYVSNLLDNVQWIGGSQPPKSTFKYNKQKGFVRFIQNRDYADNKNITYIPVRAANKLCTEKDIMMDKYGDAGLTRFGIAGAYNVALSKINVNLHHGREYIRKYLESGQVYSYLKNACMASTRASLNESILGNLKIVIPRDDTLCKFEKMAERWMDAALVIKKENQKLAELRDWLLPMLMNGQVKVGKD